MRFVITILAFLMIGAAAQAQVFNQFMEEQEGTVADYLSTFDTQIVQQRNKIGKATVVELYEQGTGRFVGYRTNKKSFNPKKLPFLKRKGMKKLLKNHSIPAAVAIYQNEVIAGMTAEEVELSWGEPNRVEEEEGITYMRYDHAVVELKENEVASVQVF